MSQMQPENSGVNILPLEANTNPVAGGARPDSKLSGHNR